MTPEKKNIWNQRFAAQLLDAMAEGVFTVDVGGQITSWNPSMEKITGYSAEEAIGKKCDIIQFSTCFDRKCPKVINECKILKIGSVNSKECQLLHKKGNMIHVIKNARVLKDNSGTTIGVVETITDLTELLSAKKKIEEANLKLAETHQFANIVGKSHAMREVFTAIMAAAGSDATILIQGESGTGKELVAGAIHYNGDRAAGPFVTVSCSALAESILESELFGHVKGAFTGAHRDRTGRFEAADGGTIFLDEIGEISPFIQLKLLRTIQERQIERVGESTKRTIDFRIIAATNKDLYSLVQEGRFREDLFYRLKVFPILIPPLRKRKEDIPLLIQHFIQAFNSKTGKQIGNISHDAMKTLLDYPWPGNVRELENAIEHAFVLCAGPEIGISDLPIEISEGRRVSVTVKEIPKDQPKNRIKPTKIILLDLLNECGWNKAEVGRRLALSRTSVWKYMKKYDIPLQ